MNEKDAAASPARSARLIQSIAVTTPETRHRRIDSILCPASSANCVRLTIAASAGIAAGVTATACAVQRLESAALCFATPFVNQSWSFSSPLAPGYRETGPHSDRDVVRIASRFSISAQLLHTLDPFPRLLYSPLMHLRGHSSLELLFAPSSNHGVAQHDVDITARRERAAKAGPGQLSIQSTALLHLPGEWA